MPVNSELMKTMTTTTICQLTPMAALPVLPTKWPTIAWSMMPCSPAMTFCSIVGHASRHTARVRGPSTRDRSNVRRAGAAVWGILTRLIRQAEGKSVLQPLDVQFLGVLGALHDEPEP